MKENLKKEHWSSMDYQKYLSELKNQENQKYKEFHQRLTTTKYPILGINVPTQRKIAKEISKGNYEEFLKLSTDSYYEEVMIEGFIIASIKEENSFWKHFLKYLPKIDNWAICDGFCNSFVLVKQEPEKYFEKFLQLLKSNEDFTIRVGLISLLSFYITSAYIDSIFEAIDEITSDSYYVNMGMAWLLAEMFAKFPKETRNYLNHAKINDFTMNKTISKILDSYRIAEDVKDELLILKRKGNK